ncbi:MAG TPA: hypothetical protein VFE72_12805, partial [Lysobacter sp.]|nr:hypothetical protein [Lysobacter sp.]
RRQARAAVAVGDVRCPMPASFARHDEPLQSDVPGGLGPFRLQPATLRPLAGFSVEARVLSRRDYDSGREADLSPTDLALGWGRMQDDAVLDRLDISQSGRWYHYRWSGEAPIPAAEIVRSSANMHLIPADAAVARALDAIDADDRVRIDGWLVEAEAADGWRWRSSLSREDSGDGACEVVYVCSLRRIDG